MAFFYTPNYEDWLEENRTWLEAEWDASGRQNSWELFSWELWATTPPQTYEERYLTLDQRQALLKRETDNYFADRISPEDQFALKMIKIALIAFLTTCLMAWVFA